MKYALSNSSRKVWEGHLAILKEYLEHVDPFNVDDLAKFVLLNEKELGTRVAETGEDIKNWFAMTSVEEESPPPKKFC